MSEKYSGPTSALLSVVLLVLPVACNAEDRIVTVHPNPHFAVDGLVLGRPVAPNSAAYRRYSCTPSEQYPDFTRCNQSNIKDGVRVSGTILHGSNLLAWYVNKQVSPAYFTPSEVESEIERLSRQFGVAPQIYRLPDNSEFPAAVIATFGGIKLQPLNVRELAILANGKSPKAGILVDFLNDFHRSAASRLPVYRLGGSEGFAWIANYDQEGKGTLRFFAADPSHMKRDATEDSSSGPERAGDVMTPLETRPQITLPSEETGQRPAFMVAMESVGGIYQVPIRINDTITLDAIVDSGASDVSVPADVVMTLMRSKTISADDFLESKTYTLADGSKVPSERFVIRSLRVGNRTLENVPASIASVNAQILLGQSFLSRFKSWSIDNQKHGLILN
ncbi:retropepsin-like aspartic protease family protein [Methylocella silvestris]|uniref:Peptidase A2 domain-containing protein n=1 Tax=Methylocella silvestris TaxID=199596 RepID=A0A2J7TG03_METSI|nr:retropepsin-like aspartic protease [Methylocella silvestris]PNG25711.1 hypothetical protein CR492_12400 [Methylocella silvestris]